MKLEILLDSHVKNLIHKLSDGLDVQSKHDYLLGFIDSLLVTGAIAEDKGLYYKVLAKQLIEGKITAVF